MCLEVDLPDTEPHQRWAPLSAPGQRTSLAMPENERKILLRVSNRLEPLLSDCEAPKPCMCLLRDLASEENAPE
jgi:hypothetical protein